MDNLNVIAIKDVVDGTVEECTWEEWYVANKESGSMEIEELNDIEATLDRKESYHMGGGASTELTITWVGKVIYQGNTRIWQGRINKY